MASSLEMTEMYDNALLGILQHVGNIQDFLQVYFGFLYRKTDFYRLMSSSNDKMGFPPGVAEKMVLKTFKLFEKVAERDRERQLSELQRREEGRTVPPAVQELEISSDPQEESPHPRTEETQIDTTSKVEDALSPPLAAPVQDAQQSNSPTKQSTEGDQAAAADPSNETQKYQSDPDSYNGAVRENYSWSQDATDVEVRVFVPKTIVKGRQVSVNLQSGSVSVSVKDGAEQKTLMEGEFTHKINTENSLWSLEPGKCVVLSLNKTSDIWWWNAVLKGEKEIDVNEINRERSMATVDEEEHAVLDRLTFDYHQKLQGKPQSHELKVHEMLKKGWDAEGSPFKGQQFDPSMFDIPSSAVQF
ncbi:nudC domain-containing protein 3 [Periophthalmus magnuspinnatus]|uniref:nudC domain-containing protein 3 n=1 Tax=Periophthalmus magnuspinnatus TaxID=409849 RepID=UPI00145AE13F|nr:nudC domain-containing protein 3 [Periophthalmus magnuspinnatus]